MLAKEDVESGSQGVMTSRNWMIQLLPYVLLVTCSHVGATTGVTSRGAKQKPTAHSSPLPTQPSNPGSVSPLPNTTQPTHQSPRNKPASPPGNTSASPGVCSSTSLHTIGYPAIPRLQWSSGLEGYLFENYGSQCEGHLTNLQIFLAGSGKNRDGCRVSLGIFRRVVPNKRVYRLVYSATVTAAEWPSMISPNMANKSLAWMKKGDIPALAVLSAPSSTSRCFTFSGPYKKTGFYSKLCKWSRTSRQTLNQYVDCTRAIASKYQLVYVSLQAQIKTILYCAFEDEVDTHANVYRWYPAANGSVAVAPCPCQPDRMAYRLCELSGYVAVWSASNRTACTAVSSQCTASSMNGLMQVRVTTGNMPTMLQSTVSFLRKAGGRLTTNNVTMAANVLRNISQTAKYNRMSKQNFMLFVSCVDNMFHAKRTVLRAAQRQRGAGNSLLRSIDNFVDSINMTNSSTEYSTDNVAFILKEERRRHFAGSTLSVFIKKDSSNTTLSLNIEAKPKKELMGETSAVSLVLPANITSAATASVIEDDQDELVLLFNAFHKTDLFLPSAGPGSGGDEGELASVIVGCRVGTESMQNLSQPVMMSFELATTLPANFTQPACVYWDFKKNNNTGGWSTDGCHLVNYTANSRRAICECTHLTNFAIVMNPNSQQVSLAHKKAFSAITYAGVGLSLFGVTVTIISLVLIRQLWEVMFNRILCNFCVSLAFVNILVLVVAETSTDSNACTVAAVLLHYFVLSTFSWSVVQAFNLYHTLIKVFSSGINNFMKKAALFSWGFPVVVIFITMAVGKFSLDAYDSKGQTSCRLENPEFLIAMFVPVCLFLFVDLAIVMYVVVFVTRKSSIARTSQNHQTWKRNVRLTLSSSILLGLTWLLGLFMLSDSTANIASQYAFSIFNSLLGFFIFIVKVVLPSQVRHAWRTLDFSPQSSSSSLATTHRWLQSKRSSTATTITFVARPARTSADSVALNNVSGKLLTSSDCKVSPRQSASPSPSTTGLVTPTDDDIHEDV